MDCKHKIGVLTCIKIGILYHNGGHIVFNDTSIKLSAMCYFLVYLSNVWKNICLKKNNVEQEPMVKDLSESGTPCHMLSDN